MCYRLIHTQIIHRNTTCNLVPYLSYFNTVHRIKYLLSELFLVAKITILFYIQARYIVQLFVNKLTSYLSNKVLYLLIIKIMYNNNLYAMVSRQFGFSFDNY